MKNIKLIAVLFLFAIFGNISLLAQNDRPKPTQEQIDAWRKAEDERMRNDWASLKRFAENNKQIGMPTPDEKRIVFMVNP